MLNFFFLSLLTPLGNSFFLFYNVLVYTWMSSETPTQTNVMWILQPNWARLLKPLLCFSFDKIKKFTSCHVCNEAVIIAAGGKSSATGFSGHPPVSHTTQPTSIILSVHHPSENSTAMKSLGFTSAYQKGTNLSFLPLWLSNTACLSPVFFQGTSQESFYSLSHSVYFSSLTT